MNGFRQYIEGNPEVFAALVAFLAIGGGLLGSVIGARIQANGGRDQAAAAREAAQIAAESQRVAALWSVRQVQVAQFIQSARELVAVSALLYRSGGDDVGLRDLGDRLEAASRAMALGLAEIQLVAPAGVVVAATRVAHSAKRFQSMTLLWGPHLAARVALRRLSSGEDRAVGGAARAAMRVLDDRHSGVTSCREALAAVDGLGEGHVQLLGGRHRRRASDRQIRVWRNGWERDFNDAMVALVLAARGMLKSGGDVAPAPLQRRRRWWQAA
ncbi:hypothetical protein [Streptomyces gardneri]|uniref:hypothetical protein n=1 Tax=Streptomyces gardneri TaxID=66892 RepID=UPI0035DF8FF2